MGLLLEDHLRVLYTRVRFAQKLKLDNMSLHIYRLPEVRPSTKIHRWSKTPTAPSNNPAQTALLLGYG